MPIALLDVALEDFPAGEGGWAWALAGVLAAGAIALALRPAPAAGVAFDVAIVSAFVVLYAFDPGTPVRLLLVLPTIEGAILFARAGGAAAALAAAPALALFEWRSDVAPFDPIHVLGPVGILLLTGLAVGSLRR